jgi:hypothetical protein
MLVHSVERKKRAREAPTSLVRNDGVQSYVWNFPTQLSPLAQSRRTRPSDYLSPCADASAAGELTIASMRKLSTPASSFFLWKSFVLNTHRFVLRAPPVAILQQFLPSRHLAQVRTEPLSEVWFTPSSPRRSPADDLLGSPGNGSDYKPPDERTLRLGKSEWSF